MSTNSCVLKHDSQATFGSVDLEYDANYSVADGKFWWEDIEENTLIEHHDDDVLRRNLSRSTDNDDDNNNNNQSDEDGIITLDIHVSSWSYKAEVIPERKNSRIYVLDTDVYTVCGMEIIWEEEQEEEEIER
ncbi:uncharacterized protein LOC121374131 [Gigantopelta aegis]|uniref:uncharacterized protein LOC121374131 n=1 Tax=Gigantopelta aegis TaxID=1735272 RepID=UPI001B889F27|nr:uncharacterized protein LOC121374131 [Gigantopelta aegis]